MKPWFIVLCIAHVPLRAQTVYFDQSYDVNSQAENGRPVAVVDSGYIMVNTSITSGKNQFAFIRTDNFGTEIVRNVFGANGYVYGTWSVNKKTDSTWAIAGVYQHPDSSNYDMFTAEIDQHGDTIWFKVLGTSFTEGAKKVLVLSGGDLAVFGTRVFAVNQEADFLLIKTDPFGNPIWERELGLPATKYENGYDIIQTPDGGFVLSGNRTQIGVANSRRFLLIRTDSDGNQLWEKTYGGPYNDWGGYVTKSMEGGFMLGGYKALNAGNDSGKLWLIKVDDLGVMQWNKVYTTPSMVKGEVEGIEQLVDGSYVIVGNNRIDYYRGWILKVDQEGAMLWSRLYTRNLDNHNYFWDFAPTPDGGFVVCGTTHNTTQDAWLLKLDSLGCNEPNCDTVAGVIHVPLPAMQLEVWPNPTDGIVNMKLPVRKIGMMEVVDVMGRVALASPPNPLSPGEGGQFTADLSGLPSGVYVVRVEADGKTWQAKVVKR